MREEGERGAHWLLPICRPGSELFSQLPKNVNWPLSLKTLEPITFLKIHPSYKLVSSKVPQIPRPRGLPQTGQNQEAHLGRPPCTEGKADGCQGLPWRREGKGPRLRCSFQGLPLTWTFPAWGRPTLPGQGSLGKLPLKGHPPEARLLLCKVGLSQWQERCTPSSLGYMGAGVSSHQ